MENDELFKHRLQEAIAAHPELSAAGLSMRAGLDKSTIRNLFNGKTRSVKLDTARKICAALGTTLQDFMQDDRPSRDQLTADEAEIVRLTNLLPDELRRQLLGYAQALADRPSPPQTPKRQRSSRAER